jgi:hypothetical protein
MEAYPGYRCPNCGGHSNMMGTGHWASEGSGYACKRAASEGLLPLNHYDLGPDLSVDWQQRAGRWVKLARGESGSSRTLPISEAEALQLVAERLPELNLQVPDDLPIRVLEAQEQRLRGSGRRRLSELGE